MDNANNLILSEKIMQLLNIFQKLETSAIRQIFNESDEMIQGCIKELKSEGKITQDKEKRYITKNNNDLKNLMVVNSKDPYWGLYRFGSNNILDFFKFECPNRGVFLLCVDEPDSFLIVTEAINVNLGTYNKKLKLS